MNSQFLFSIKVTTSPQKDILKHIADYLAQKNTLVPLTVFSVNPEIVIEARKNSIFRDILNKSDINLPDGAGVVWAVNRELRRVSGVSRAPRVLRVSGIDFMEELVGLAAQKGYPVALIGGRDGVCEKTLNNLQKRHSGLTGWAEEIGEIKLDKLDQLDMFKKLARRIIENRIKLVFVGLGAPKQEFFIKAISHQLSAIRQSESSNLKADSLIFMSVGGAFDILAGKLSRAPQIVRQLNLEWLWRLGREPRRIKRQFNLLKFIILVIRERSMVK